MQGPSLRMRKKLEYPPLADSGPCLFADLFPFHKIINISARVNSCCWKGEFNGKLTY